MTHNTPTFNAFGSILSAGVWSRLSKNYRCLSNEYRQLTNNLREYIPYYYPFGSTLPTRSWSDASRAYRYGFNGKEIDSETANDNYDFRARIYDARLARWYSIDPLMKKYVYNSPYVFSGNDPIFFVDKDGKEISTTNGFDKSPYYSVYTKLLSKNSVYSTLLSKYKGGSKFNLKLHYGENKEISVGANAQTNVAQLENTNGKLVGCKGDTYFSSQSELMSRTSEITQDGKTYIVTETKSDISMARTILHESLHCYLAAEGINEDNKHNKYSTYRWQILQGLIEYNNDNKLGYTKEQLVVLSWEGLQFSKAFEKYIKENYMKDGKTYEEAKNAWIKEKDALSYKEKSRVEKVEAKETPVTEKDSSQKTNVTPKIDKDSSSNK